MVRDVSTMTSGVSGFQGTVSKDTVVLDTAFENVVCQDLESCGTGSENNSFLGYGVS